MSQNYSKLEYRQMKGDEVVISYMSDKFTSCKNEAEKIARICNGSYDWQGCKEVASNHGLARLANAWLKKNGKTARVYEVQYSNYSIYYPTFANQI